MEPSIRLTLAAGMVIGLILAAPPAQAAYPGRNGLIAFEQSGDTWTIKPGAKVPKRITRDGTSRQPRWSADGKKIAVAGRGDIWTINPDGSSRKQVTTGPDTDFNPTWSPDGKQVAFARWLPGKKGVGSIWAAAAGGGRAVKLSTDPPSTCASEPAWSSTGRYLVYQRARSCIGYDQSIVMLDLVRKTSRVIATGQVKVAGDVYKGLVGPDFMPDGRHVIFQAGTSGCGSVEVKTDLAGKGPTIFQWLSACDLDWLSEVAAAPDGRRYTGIYSFYSDGDERYNVIGTSYWMTMAESPGPGICSAPSCTPSNPDWQPER